MASTDARRARLIARRLAAAIGVAGALAGGCGRGGDATATTTTAGGVATAAGSTTASTSAGAAPRRVDVEGKAMGTLVTIAAFTSDGVDEPGLRAKLEAALVEIRRVEGLLTTWREDGEVARVNAAAGKDAVRVGPETLEVIEKSLWASRASEGVFDVTFEAMRGLWRFDHDGVDHVPSPAAIAAARRLIDFRRVVVDHDARTVRLATAGMRMSLGGIGKGYAVDAAARVLGAAGVPSFVIRAGGDLYVRGRKPDGAPFRVGVRDPRSPDPDEAFAMVEVEDHAFSTAGDYERAFVKGGKRYHHIIDPRTGWPATASRSVTIWARDALTADALDDAVFILGPAKGLALVESVEGCGAVVVDAENRVWISKRLAGKVEVLHPPTDGV